MPSEHAIRVRPNSRSLFDCSFLLIVNASFEAGTDRQGCVTNEALFASPNRTIFNRFDPRGFGWTRVRVRKSILSVSSASRTRGCNRVRWDKVHHRSQPGGQPPGGTVGVYHPRTFPRPHFLYLRISFHRTTDKAPTRLHSICIATSWTRLKRYALTPSIHSFRLRFTPSTFIAIR